MSVKAAVVKTLSDADLPRFALPPEGLGMEEQAALVRFVNEALARAEQYLIAQRLEIQTLRAQVHALSGVPQTPFTLLTEVRTEGGANE